MGQHISVLLNESIDLLDIKKNGTYLDLTLGRAGHSSEILKRIPNGRLIGVDQDPEAIKESQERLSKIAPNFTIVKDNFSHLDSILAKLEIEEVDGILMDLGVSSPQFDEGDRGFSYTKEARLDMRMDPSNPLSAYEVVNLYSYEKLVEVIESYGEDPDARRIAKAIVEARSQKLIETTTELADIVKSAKPMKSLLKKGHPAKQTFQAIRIEVNDEEGALKRALELAPKYLKVGGRLAIITFMSLDDRLVKRAFHDLSTIEGSRHGVDLLPNQIPTPKFSLVNKKPIVPNVNELENNHRAASAKLRGLERTAK